jgi:D-alanyl-D-alanine carboxypeptidase/D-alanyl-D-alanine-endopeptidase (penicillin-binding protein 4)
MWSRLLALALLLLPSPALASVKDKVAALAPSALVLVMDAKGDELVAQNADEPFVPMLMSPSSRRQSPRP